MGKDYKKMLEDIDALVNNDWGYDIESHALPPSHDFTQAEAIQMAEVIGQVYTIAHAVHCAACGKKYVIGVELEEGK